MRCMRFLLLILLLVSQLSFAQSIFPSTESASGTADNPNYVAPRPDRSAIPAGFSFTPPPTDLSVSYLSDIFGVVDGVLHGTGSQLLGTMFGVFNAAILTIGGVILTYILFVSTMNTAHEGKVLGQKWSSIWIPIRAVVGIAAMLPKASGYSFIQILLMWLVVQGVGAADSIWYAALNYFQRGGILVQHVQNLRDIGNVSNNMTMIWGSPASILKSQICMYTLRNGLQALPAPSSQVPKAEVPDFNSSIVVAGGTSNQSPPCYDGDGRAECKGKTDTTGIIYFPGNVSFGGVPLKGVCGSVTWDFAQDTSSASGAINYANLGGFDSRSLAVQQMVFDLQGAAYSISQILLPTGPNQTGRAPKIYDFPSGVLVNAVTDYITTMKPYLNTAGQKAAAQVKDQLTDAALKGWVLAGSYYFLLSNLNNATSKIVDTVQPKGNYPQDYSATAFGINPTVKNALAPITNAPIELCWNRPPGIFNDFVCSEFSYTEQQKSGTQPSIPQGPSQQQRPGQAAPPWWQAYPGQTTSNLPATMIGPSGEQMNFLAGRADTGWFVTDWLLNKIIFDNVNGIMSKFTTLQQSDLDPLLAISSLGNTILNTIEQIWLYGTLTVISIGLFSVCSAGNPFGFAWISGIIWIVPMFTLLLFTMFVAGLMFAFYIPLIPAIIFLFAAIGWFIAVIEAMIAGPLVALGLISPEGHEYFGQAQAAINLTLNIFIRPTLILFGFITASILVHVALWLWNMTISTAMTNFTFDRSNIVTFFAVILIYMTVVLSIVNRCFALIHEIPSHVLAWIGANVRSYGEAEAVRGVEQEAGGKMGALGGVGEKFGGVPYKSAVAARGALQKYMEGKGEGGEIEHK